MGSGDFGNQVGGTGPADQPDAYGQPQYWNAPTYREAGPYGQPGPYVPRRKTNALAIASLCCGIGQLLVGLIAGIPAIVLGFVAISQIRRTGEDGRGMAIADIVLGFISIIATAVLIVVFLVLVHGLSNNTATF
jgi:Domain of unknown function (DUF4190)